MSNIQRHRKDYTETEKEAALTAYVFAGGHREKASAMLRDQGIHIPAETIRYWAKTSEVERLERIRVEVAPKIKAQMAEVHQSLAISAAEIEALAVKRLKEALDRDEVKPKDLSAVHQRSAIAGGIHSEKHLLYSGQPTAIVQRDATEILRKLAQRGVVVEGEAVEEETVSEVAA